MNDIQLVEEIIQAFDKNNELSNYHMLSTVDNKTFDVNIEYLEGQTYMAGNVVYVAQILSHVDMSVVEERQVKEFIYKKGESTMAYREGDGVSQFDVSFDNIILYESEREKLNEYRQALQDNTDGENERIKINAREDGTKEYVYDEIYHYVVSADGYLISYTDDGGFNFSIDTLNEVVLDYTYYQI